VDVNFRNDVWKTKQQSIKPEQETHYSVALHFGLQCYLFKNWGTKLVMKLQATFLDVIRLSHACISIFILMTVKFNQFISTSRK